MEQTATHAGIPQPTNVVFPYPPSWIDRFILFIARQPGPAWLYYFGMALVLFLAYVGVKWWEGQIPRELFSMWSIVVCLTGFYYLTIMHYRNEIARDAMLRFRPALDIPAWRIAELEYRLTTMPPKTIWLLTFLGIVEGTLTLIGMASGRLQYPGPPSFVSVPASILEGILIILIGVFFVICVYHTIHQLHIVRVLYAELTTVNLFHQTPLHAFARLSAFIVISWMTPQYFWLTGGLESTAFGVAFTFFCIAVALGIIAFVWPLLGIHRLLVAEKETLQAAAHRRLQNSLAAFDTAIDRGDLAPMDGISKAIDNAERECRVVNALPTWPWQPGLLRNAATAFFLPLVLWVATRLLEQLISP